jgi:hypothetical protein
LQNPGTSTGFRETQLMLLPLIEIKLLSNQQVSLSRDLRADRVVRRFHEAAHGQTGRDVPSPRGRLQSAVIAGNRTDVFGSSFL